MDGCGAFVLRIDISRMPSRAHHLPLLCPLKVPRIHRIRLVGRRLDRRLVHHRLQVRARKADRPAGDDRDVDALVVVQDVAEVVAQDRDPPAHVRQRHHHRPVETSRTDKRFVERLGEVGCADEDDTLAGLEAVQLDQELVQRLLGVVLILG